MIVRFNKRKLTRKRLQEMVAWCSQYPSTEYTISVGGIFWFRDERMATLFQLYFSGSESKT